MIVNLALLAVLLIVAAAVFRGGLLQGMVMFFNVLLAASFATAWYEAFAAYLERYLAPYTYFLDVIALWSCFAVVLIVLATVTSRLFKTKVLFAPPVELGGRVLIGLMTGWTVAEFTALSVHTAPLRNDVVPMPPNQTMLFGLKPDRCWLWWVRGSSRNGPFAVGEAPFDPATDFLERHEQRRKSISQGESLVRPET
jgi:hypothetical protein